MNLSVLIAETQARMDRALDTVRAARLAVEARTRAIEALLAEPCAVCGLTSLDHPDTPDCFNAGPDPDLRDPILDDAWENRTR